MEEWRELRVDEGDGNAKGNSGFGFDLDFELEKCRFDSCKERLRGVFDQVLVGFMSEKSGGKSIRPIPVLCGDGRPVDLFKLFWVVRKIGGHDAVSRNNLWGFVSEECGLGLGLIPSIKLIYMKYLKELDQWLQQVFSKRDLEDGQNGLVQKLDLLSRELETRFRGVLPDGQEQGKDSNFVKHAKDRANILCSGDGHSRLSVGRVAEDIICKVHGDIDSSIDDSFTESTKKVVRKAVNESNGFCKGEIGDGGGKSCDEDSDNIVASAKRVIEKVINRILNCGETVAVAAVDDERFSVQDNADLRVSAKKVVKKVISRTHDLSDNITHDKDRVSAEQSTDTAIPARSDVGDVLDSRKRKRQSHSFRGMLNWLKDVAKHSNDPSLGIPECSKMNDYGKEEFWVQALLVREALLIRRPATNGGENLLKLVVFIIGSVKLASVLRGVYGVISRAGNRRMPPDNANAGDVSVVGSVFGSKLGLGAHACALLSDKNH
ncbi:UNVERIFIED_CONTAM: AT-rich interactive domain-containing protein 2 [Sesamum radiatum]|uniref:AT-rich interactive domain-containing protein 2 n=1 Tax=Sesamum radiatum TaxID=300843 RepID=A0AAW2TUE4_SESRA